MEEILEEIKESLQKEILTGKKVMNYYTMPPKKILYRGEAFEIIAIMEGNKEAIKIIDEIIGWKIYDIDFYIIGSQKIADKKHKQRREELHNNNIKKVRELLQEEFNHRLIVEILTKAKEKVREFLTTKEQNNEKTN